MYHFTKLKDARGTIVNRKSIGKTAIYSVKDSKGKVVDVPQYEFTVHGEHFGIITILNQKYILPLGLTFQWDTNAKSMGAEPVWRHQELSKADGAHRGVIVTLNKASKYAVLEDVTGHRVVIPYTELGSIIKVDNPKLSVFDNPDYVITNHFFKRGDEIQWSAEEPARGPDRVKDKV